jgi:hypothetical protein
MSDHHVCTGCGQAAHSQCPECGEWRCLECRTLGGGCANRLTPAGSSHTERGEFCARNRPEAKRGAKCRCSIVGHVCEGAVRGIRGTLHGEPFGEHLYYCAKFLASLPGSVVSGWLEVPDLTWHMAVARVRGQAGEPRVVLKVPAGLPPGKYEAEYAEDPSWELGMDPATPECFGSTRAADCSNLTCAHHFIRYDKPDPLSCLTELHARQVNPDSWACTTCGNDLRRDPDGRHWDPADGRGYCDCCWKKHKAAPEDEPIFRIRSFDRPLTPADRAKLWQDFDAKIDAPSHLSPVPHTSAEVLAALGNPPGWTEANVLGIHEFGRAADASTSRVEIYCEHAPPRELVVRTMVRCGTGLEGGRPVMGPMVWTWKMQREWERHVAFNAGVCVPWRFEAGQNAGQEPDAFGGKPLTDSQSPRCPLCGGWMRSVEVSA